MLQLVGLALLLLLGSAVVAWTSLALHYTGPGTPPVRNALAALALLLPASILVRTDSLGITLIAAAIAFVLALARFLSIRPPQHADWDPGVARLARASFAGDLMTIENVRDFTYRSQDDFTACWETRTYDLSTLEGLDIFFARWSSPAIAHTILSWRFFDGRHLAVSVETRKRAGQRYSAIAGFFRQYPIYYVVADERDVVLLRTCHRGEDVWLYPLQISRSAARSLLLEYIESINRLASRPAWYNALTDNCTTTIRTHVHRLSPDHFPWSWRLLLNGHLPELLYEQGRIDRSMPFSEVREAARIDARAANASRDDFSRAIRGGLPTA